MNFKSYLKTKQICSLSVGLLTSTLVPLPSMANVLENASAVPLYLSMKEEVTGYPLKIVIPGNKKTVISVPSERHSVSYMVNNFIISPMQLLEVKLF